MNEREYFEAWFKKNYTSSLGGDADYYLELEDDEYQEQTTQNMWETWKDCAESKQSELDRANEKIAELSSELESTSNRCVEWAASKGEILGMYEESLVKLDKANARIAQLAEEYDTLLEYFKYKLAAEEYLHRKANIRISSNTWLSEHDKAVEINVLEEVSKKTCLHWDCNSHYHVIKMIESRK